jgi:hypothetical protein
MDDLIKHFLHVNEHDNLYNVRLVQEIYTIAYSLKVTSSYLSLKINNHPLIATTTTIADRQILKQHFVELLGGIDNKKTKKQK